MNGQDLISQTLKHQVPVDVLHAVVPEEDSVLNRDLRGTSDHQLYDFFEVPLAHLQLSWVDVCGFKCSEEKLDGCFSMKGTKLINRSKALSERKS